MKCRHCNTVLAPLRSLTDGEFCSDEHRQTFYEDQDARASAQQEQASPPTPEASASFPAMADLLPLTFESHPVGPPQSASGQLPDESAFPGAPMLPGSGGEQSTGPAVSEPAHETAQSQHNLSRDMAASWRW